jgi:C-terminal processing protease CtpA/Prc
MTMSKDTTIALNPQERAKILASVKTAVLKHHINVGGVNYDAWTALVDQRTPGLLEVDTSKFESGVKEILSELKSSHIAFFHEGGKQLLPQHTLNVTLRSFPFAGGERWFFLDVFEGGPGHSAGIKPGEMLLAVNGTEHLPPTMPPFNVGETYDLMIADAGGQNIRHVSAKVPRRRGTKTRPPIVEPKPVSHAMAAPGIGLLRVTYFPGELGIGFANALDPVMKSLKQNGANRLIIDLRGNIGGGLGLARLASYLCPGQIPIGYSLTPGRLRKGYKKEDLPSVPMPQTRLGLLWTLGRFTFRDKSIFLLTQGLGSQPFHNRTVLLVNEWTNSAAEMVAGFAAENGLATIVGKKTAGNVLGAANFKVGSGYWVRLPIFGWYTSKGDCLEGKGVSPHMEVEIDPALLNTGIDQQMNKAIDTLTDPENIPRLDATKVGGHNPA